MTGMTRTRIRAAKFADINAILALGDEALSRSRYRAATAIDRDPARAFMRQVIANHGGTSEGSTFAAVADNGVCLDGVILGLLQRFYFVCDTLEATDLIFYARDGADPAVALRLLRAMHKWAKDVPGLVRIVHAPTDLIEENGERVGRLFEAVGCRRVGGLYVLEVTK